MNANQNIRQRLIELNIDDTRQVDSMVVAMTARAYEMPAELIKIMQDPREDERVVVKARFLVQSIGNLGFSPVFDALPADNPDNLMFSMHCAVNQHKENLAGIIRQLKILIVDNRKLTTPDYPASTEEQPPEMRVCDEAYVMMRGLCAAEGAEDAMVNARIFITSMDEKEREKEIGRFTASNEWISLQEQTDDVTGTSE